MDAIPARRFTLWAAHGDNPWVKGAWFLATMFVADLYAMLPPFANDDRLTTVAIFTLLAWFGFIIGTWLLSWSLSLCIAGLALVVGRDAAMAVFEFAVVLFIGLCATHFQAPLVDAFESGVKHRAFYRATDIIWKKVSDGFRRSLRRKAV